MIVVLKGAGTLIAHPDGRVLVNATGNPGMATAGAGDVLAGAIAGLIGQGYEPFVAAGLAVHVHGRAGDLAAVEYGQEGVTASKLSRSLGRALKSILYSA
jgi:NAD(P)H-hydrate epimerase